MSCSISPDFLDERYMVLFASVLQCNKSMLSCWKDFRQFHNLLSGTQKTTYLPGHGPMKKKIHTHIQKIIIIIVALLLPALYRTGVKAVIPKLHQAPLHKVVCSSGEQIPCTKDITGKAGRGWGDRT